jgi:hypothetical protein
MADICTQIITIPQFDNTNICWFNAILMSLLYSQHSRNLLLSIENGISKRRDKISKILDQILRRQIIKNEYEDDYFKFMTSQRILKYFNIFSSKEQYLSILKTGHDSSFEIHKCIEKFGKTSLDLIVYNNKIYSNFKFIIDELKILLEIIKEKNKATENNKAEIEEKEREIIRQLILKIQSFNIETVAYNPDYIIVHPVLYIPNTKTSRYDFIFLAVLNILKQHNLIDKILLDSYDISKNGIAEFNDEITYNGETYILDSCILSNYNVIGNLGHALTGITCNNNRYIYNGIYTNSRSTIDTSIISKRKCDLIKYSWNINSPIDFCLNPIMCKAMYILPEIKDKVLCYSFNKGPRALVYVNKKDLKKTIPEIYKNTSKSLSNFELPSTISKSAEKETMQKFIDDLQLKINKIEPKRRRI